MTQSPFQYVTPLQLVFGDEGLLNRKMVGDKEEVFLHVPGEKTQTAQSNCQRWLLQSSLAIKPEKTRSKTLQDVPALKDTTGTDQSESQATGSTAVAKENLHH